MLYQILGFLLQLSSLYLLIAMFILLDLLLLSIRVRRLKREKEERDTKQVTIVMEQRRKLREFEQRHAHLAG
jgi:membrane protein implicated in regulation of membrane protease activity